MSYKGSRRFLGGALLAALLGAGAGCGGGSANEAKIYVFGLSLMTKSLQPAVGLKEGTLADRIAPIDLGFYAGSDKVLFSLFLPDGMPRDGLVVGLRTLDRKGGAGCILDLGGAPIGTADTVVTLRMVPNGEGCGTDRSPRLVSVTPASARGGETLSLSGWDFDPQARDQVGGQPATVSWTSPAAMDVTPAWSALTPGMLPVTVTNSDGKSDSSDMLLTYTR